MPEEQEMTTVPQMVDDVRTGKLPRRKLVKILTGLGISTAGAGAIAAAAASRAITDKPKPVRNVDEQPTQNLDLHDQHLAHQQQGNIDGLNNDYAHNAVVEDSMHAEAFVGREAIMNTNPIFSRPDSATSRSSASRTSARTPCRASNQCKQAASSQDHFIPEMALSS